MLENLYPMNNPLNRIIPVQPQDYQNPFCCEHGNCEAIKIIRKKWKKSEEK